MSKATWSLIIVVAVLMPGCIHHESTVYREVERTRVEFESDAAARVFYEALSKSPSSRRRTESETEVHIPIVFEHKRREVEGDNSRFNRAVERCDTNRDGKITEQEARIYARNR